jgi:hypothetical protein
MPANTWAETPDWSTFLLLIFASPISRKGAVASEKDELRVRDGEGATEEETPTRTAFCRL